jgi:hypothetical protein
MSTQPIPALISLNTARNIAYWTKELNCTEAQLLAAMDIVGNKTADVRKQLNQSTLHTWKATDRL